MDTVIDFVSVYIIDPIRDFLQGKFSFQAWAKHTGISFLLGLAMLVCVFAAAYFWCMELYILFALFAAAIIYLLIVDWKRTSRWRKETGRED